MQNLHRHSNYSNIFTSDSTVTNEDYAKRAVELGHKVLSSVEHGFQGYYFQTYELAHKYNLKCVIGAEAYWVKNRTTDDKSNHHILILAKNNNGREALNDILSEANISGYYYKPRVDLDLLLSLPASDVFITSACIAFSGYEDIDDIILKLHKHFQDNFALEIQYHNTNQQKKWNQHLKELSNTYNINLIVGLDSHYIYPEQAIERDNYIEAKGIDYPEEDGWYMDYPDDETVMNRFLEQGIFCREEIQAAMDLTDISLNFDDYDDVPIFSKDIKLPTLYPNLTKEEKDKLYSKLITQKFKEYMKNIPSEEYDRYFEGVKAEVQTYKDTGMVDYPLLDYQIVKRAKELGGLITDTGRGSAVGFFTNTLCGFSSVDRFTSAIKLYPERFISTTRILETHSLPDIDLNVGNVEIFEQAQREVLGEEHVAPMIAFGTFKKKSAFKVYAKSQNMDFKLANTISNQMADYELAIKHADDDDKDLIDLYDYVDPQYKPYIDASEKYWGIISDKKKAPSAYLLYQGNIRKEIGLIKCKSESTKKEYITCVIDGAIAENYKFLKNDLLKVDVVLLIEKVFNRIGIEHFDVNTLLDLIKDDKEFWDLYANGYTIGINQVEKDGSRHRCMNYKPKNISELAAFVAAIRPGFKSMYSRYEKREEFSWGIPTLDKLVSTKELPVPFLFFQEQVMSVLNYAGFPMDQCYGIIKAIAKKHPEKVKPLKQQFIDGFRKQIIKDEHLDNDTAQNYSEQVWQIVNDNCGYGFNSAHAFCMALDSSYQAWQKVHYPYEFYEVLLQHYADKGNKDKVAILKDEMKKGFGINEGYYNFRCDNRKFVADKNHHCINPALSSIKGLSDRLAEELYNLKDNQYDSFIDLLKDIKNTSCNSRQLDTLIKLDYFNEFGNANKLLITVEYFDMLNGKKIIRKDKSEIPNYLLEKYCDSSTEKQYRFSDESISRLLCNLCDDIEVKKPSLKLQLDWQQELLGYINIVKPNLSENLYYITDKKGDSTQMWTLYCLADGSSKKIKCRKKTWNSCPVEIRDIVEIEDVIDDKKWAKVGDDWVRLDETEKVITKYKKMA